MGARWPRLAAKLVLLLLLAVPIASSLFELPVAVDGVEQVLRVNEGDNLVAAAAKFCNDHALDPDTEELLISEMRKRGFGDSSAPATNAAEAPSATQPILPSTVKVPIIVDEKQLDVELRRGDDIQEVAREFCVKHGVGLDMQQAVADIIKNYVPDAAPQGRQEQAETILFSININLDGKDVPLTVMTGEEKNMVAVAQRFCDTHGVDAENIPALHDAMIKELEKITSGERAGAVARQVPRSEPARAEAPGATFSAPPNDAAPKVQYSAPAVAEEPEFMAQRPTYWATSNIFSWLASMLVCLAILAVGTACVQPRKVTLAWISPALVGAKNHANAEMYLQREVDKLHALVTDTKPWVMIQWYDICENFNDTCGRDQDKAECKTLAAKWRNEYKVKTQQHDRAAGVISSKEFAKQESYIVVPLKPGSRARTTNKYQRSAKRMNKAEYQLRNGGVELDVDQIELARDDVPLMGGEARGGDDTSSVDTADDDAAAALEGSMKGKRLNAMGCDLDEVAATTEDNKWAVFDDDFAVRKIEADAKKAEENQQRKIQMKAENDRRAQEMKQLVIEKQQETAQKILDRAEHGDAQEIERYERDHTRAQEKAARAERELELKHEVLVEGLPWTASDEELKKLFGGFALVAAAEAIAAEKADAGTVEDEGRGEAESGEQLAAQAKEHEKEHGVEEVELINSNIDGKFQGVAYVRFASTAAVDAALQFYKVEERKERDDKSFAFRLGGRRLRVRDALRKDRQEEQRQARLQMVVDMEKAEIQAALAAVHKANPRAAKQAAESKQEEEDGDGEAKPIAIPEESTSTNTGNPFEDAMNSLGLSLHTKLVVKQLVVDTVVDRMLARKDPKALAKREEERRVADVQRNARYAKFLGSEAGLREKLEEAVSRGGKGKGKGEGEGKGKGDGKGETGPQGPSIQGTKRSGSGKGRKNPWGEAPELGSEEVEHVPGNFPALDGSASRHSMGHADVDERLHERAKQHHDEEREESKEEDLHFVDHAGGGEGMDQSSFQPQLQQRVRKGRRGVAAAHGEGSA
jgi:RNA recognition motif-containing protein